MDHFNHCLGFGVPKATPDYLDTKPMRENRALKTKLREASKHVPRYLFRMWDSKSGGDPNLNSTKRVIPHAFHRDMNLKKTVYDMTMTEFLENTTCHLRNQKHVLSEFSSWSASPRFALHYATMKRSNPYIAIIDTEGLQNAGNNVMFHVPALQQVFGTAASRRGATYGGYDWEYLVHGIVEGKHYKAITFHRLCGYGLTEQFPALSGCVNAWSVNKHSLPPLIVPYSRKEMQALDKIARLFGSDFHAAFSIALFCCKKRTSFGAELDEDALSEIVDVLGGRLNVPLDWSGSRGVVCDGIYDPRYEDNKQMVIVMRAISAHCWGKGARNRRMSEGTALIPEPDIDMLTKKMRSATVDSDVSLEQDNYSTSNSTSYSGARYDSGYGSQNYGRGHKDHARGLREKQTTKPARKSNTDKS